MTEPLTVEIEGRTYVETGRGAHYPDGAIVSGERSIHERLEAATKVLGEIVDDLGEASYHHIESETLKRVAIAAGVDHTTESNRVIESIGAALQRERDVNRELRRRIRALERGVEG